LFFFQKRCNLFAQHLLKLRLGNILVARYTFFNSVNYLNGGIHPNIRGNQRVFELVECFSINRIFTGQAFAYFIEKAFPAFFNSLLKLFLLF
jgi:hypothetical protein